MYLPSIQLSIFDPALSKKTSLSSSATSRKVSSSISRKVAPITAHRAIVYWKYSSVIDLSAVSEVSTISPHSTWNELVALTGSATGKSVISSEGIALDALRVLLTAWLGNRHRCILAYLLLYPFA